MQRVESLAHDDQVLLRQRRHRTGNRELVALTGVAQIEIRLELDLVAVKALVIEIGLGLLDQLAEQMIDLSEIEIVQTDQLGAHVVMLHVRHEQTEGGMHARRQRHEHGWNSQIARHAPGVHRAAAAKSN